MKKDVLFSVIGALIAIAICFGIVAAHGPYQPPLPGPSTKAEAAPAAAGGAAAVPPSPNDPVIMRVNGEPITEREFSLFISSMPEQMQAAFTAPAGRKSAADQLVKMKVLEQEGKRLGADTDPDLTARLNVGHANLVVEYALHKLASQPTDAQLRAAYDKERGKYELLDISHILIAYQGGSVPPRSGQALTLEQAVQKAEALGAALSKGGDFATLARQESDDTGSAGNGGRLGPVPRAQLPPDLDAAVSRLQPGQVSVPTRTRFGVHLFKLNDRKMQTMEQVKQLLQQRVAQTNIEAAIEKLQKSARVELDPKFFSSGPSAPPPPQQRPPSR